MKKNNTANEINDNKLHNTRLLLKKYRDIVWSMEVSVQHLKNDFEAEYGDTIEDYLDTIYLAGADLSGTKLEYHSKCVDQNHKMIKLINQAISILRTKHKYGEQYYWILHYTYLCPQQLSNTDEIIDNLLPYSKGYMSRRTYFRKLNEATSEVSAILWGYTATDTVEILSEFVSDY